MDSKEIKTNIFTAATWIRGLVMFLYFMVISVAKFVMAAVVLFQFGTVLITGKQNAALLSFGHSLSLYIYQIYLYLTYNSDIKPFPLASWPKSADEPVYESAPMTPPPTTVTEKPAESFNSDDSTAQS
jgi:hypothetical protein